MPQNGGKAILLQMKLLYSHQHCSLAPTRPHIKTAVNSWVIQQITEGNKKNKKNCEPGECFGALEQVVAWSADWRFLVLDIGGFFQ